MISSIASAAIEGNNSHGSISPSTSATIIIHNHQQQHHQQQQQQQRPRKSSWSAQRLDLMLNDLCDNIRRLSSASSINFPLPELEEETAATGGSGNEREEASFPVVPDDDEQQQWLSFTPQTGANHECGGEDDEDAREARTLQLILEANQHHAQYMSLMERALPIIEKLKTAKEGGFFTSLWALVRGASGKADRVLHLMHKAEKQAEQMQRKWERAEHIASRLTPASKSAKYMRMLRDARLVAARENARIDERMAEIREM